MAHIEARGGKYAFELGSILFEVDPRLGGRITTFALDGHNVIADQTVTDDVINWGSTSWPSPQRDWGVANNWPPPACIDREPYTAAVKGNTIVLTGATAPESAEVRVSFVKYFSADSAGQSVDIEIELKNEGSARSWAPWQVTRVAANGLSFFPSGATPISNTLATTQSLGVTWYQHPDGLPIVDSPIVGGKLVGHAASPWLAHVSGNFVFVQTFPALDPAHFAPGEGQIEIYASNGKKYVEVEAQGPYTWLDTGESLQWKMRWYLRKMPENARAEAANTELVDFVRRLVL